MNTTIIICVTLIVLVIGVLLALTVPQRKEKQGIDVHIDEKAGVKIRQSAEGIRLDIIYETTEDAPLYNPEEPICPDIVNEVHVSGTPDRDFFDMLATIDDLPIDQREDIVTKLAAFGFIRKEEIRDNVVVEDDPAEAGYTEAPEVDPEDVDAFDRTHPKEKDKVDTGYEEEDDLENFED